LDDENRCIFTHGDTPKIRIGFKPGKLNFIHLKVFSKCYLKLCLDRDVENLKTQVNARFSDKHVSFDLENDNACNGQNLTCPLKAGQTYFYSQIVTIANEYPAVSPRN
jgi:hypothetical protein